MFHTQTQQSPILLQAAFLLVESGSAFKEAQLLLFSGTPDVGVRLSLINLVTCCDYKIPAGVRKKTTSSACEAMKMYINLGANTYFTVVT